MLPFGLGVNFESDYALYLKVFGKDYAVGGQALALADGFSGVSDAMQHAAAVFAAMDSYSQLGVVESGMDNKYYPTGHAPTDYVEVAVPGQPGSVQYVP